MTSGAPETHIRADAPYKTLWEALTAPGCVTWQTTAQLAEAMSKVGDVHYKASRVREMLDLLERLGAVRCRAQGRTVSAARQAGVVLEFVEAVTHLTAPDCAACAYTVRYTLRVRRDANLGDGSHGPQS